MDDEFVELANPTASPVSLGQWKLSDLVQVRHVFGDDAVIPPFGFFVVFGGGAPAASLNAVAASTGTLGLNNAGDTLTLLNADLAAVDLLAYGSEAGHDASLTRSPDGQGPFIRHTSLGPLPHSPGVTVNGLPQLPLPVPLPEPPPEPDPGPFPDPGPLPGPDPLPEPDPADPPVVPEPSTLGLFTFGMAALPWLRRRMGMR
jgi:hypothetical protein